MQETMQGVNRRNLLLMIQEVEFTCLELRLYLDIYPDNQQAMDEFNKFSRKLRELKACYDREIGPLHSFGYSTSDKCWVRSTPWPWELQ